jgi:hypothetical protein
MTTSVATPPTTTAIKPIWQSKTFWLNVLMIGAAILAITDPTLIPIDPKWLVWMTGVLNILVRFLTNEPVSLTGK